MLFRSTRSGLRIVGPNSVGIIHHQRRFSLSFTPEVRYARITAGAIGIVSQSGGVCNSLTQALNRGVSISHSLSAGNSCDVDVCDLVSYLAEDDDCRAIALAFEGVEHPERLVQAGERAFAAGKPLVVFKFATGSDGAAAALSHTGALAASSAGYTAALSRMGAVLVPSYHALVETAAFFAKAGRPKAAGVATVSSSGGFAVLSADQAEARGVPMPQPDPVTQQKLDALVPEFGAARNPCDVTAQVRSDPMMLVNCLRAMFDSPLYGAVLLPFFYAKKNNGDLIQQFSQAAADAGKIGIAVWVTDWHSGWGSEELEHDEHIAVFHSMDACMQAVAAWQRWDRQLRDAGRRAPHERLAPPEAAQAARSAILESTGRSLTERASKDILALYGIPVARDRLVRDAGEAIAATAAMQGAVAIKLESPDILHKSDAGVVRLNLRHERDIEAACAEILANVARHAPDARINGLLVQEMAPQGVEIMVGARVDPAFGPMVLVGLGGIFVEVFRDAAIELAPVNRAQALGMLERIQPQKMLAGFRGLPAVDREALAGVICRLSELIADQRGLLAEIDVNPVICAGTRLMAVDALLVRTGEQAG